jgi:hypothetical protein
MRSPVSRFRSICLLIGVRHLSEKETSKGALSAILGASAWVQVPRAVLAVAADDEQEMHFHIAVVGGNRSARGAGRAFRIELADVGLKEPVTRAVELGASEKSVNDLLGELAAQPRALDYLKAKCAAEVGASGDTTWRAANALRADGRVDRRNSGTGTPWLWFLTAASDIPTLSRQEVNDFVPKTDSDFVSSATRQPHNGRAEVTPDELGLIA